MNRIERIFKRLRDEDRRALMPYLTVGDPDLTTTERLLPAIEAAGASVCELGLAFSDPIADGPVIQESMTHALNQGLKLDAVLEMVGRVRPKLTMGLVAMVSYSIVHRRGPQRFVSEAMEAGFDGFIFPDLPLEASGPIREAVAEAGGILSMLVAPTTAMSRAKAIAAASTGFVYVVSRSGITGERAEIPPELSQRLAGLRGVTRLPMAVGFGIANASQVRAVVRGGDEGGGGSAADAAIVGSAVVRRIADHREEGTDAVVQAVERFVAELARGLEPRPGGPGDPGPVDSMTRATPE